MIAKLTRKMKERFCVGKEAVKNSGLDLGGSGDKQAGGGGGEYFTEVDSWFYQE